MSSLDDVLIGRVIADKYRVDKTIARGGFSTVYRGVHVGMNRPIAIKALEIHDNVQATWIERFSREARVVSQLTHPNTITIFDFGQVGSEFLYIVMEYVRGRSMSRYIKKFGPIAPEKLARFAMQIARSLDEAHHMGIIHRDLKPSNIMIAVASSGEESVKVLDFGVAKLLDPEPDVDIALTQVGAFVGTPRYASPEQLRREELDHRSDIYGLGMIMWEALVGEPAVHATDYGTCIQYHLGPDKWRLPPGFDIPEPLADIVHRCLEKDRADRYISCGQVADELEAFAGKMQYGQTNRLTAQELRTLDVSDESIELAIASEASFAEERPTSRADVLRESAEQVAISSRREPPPLRTDPDAEASAAAAELDDFFDSIALDASSEPVDFGFDDEEPSPVALDKDQDLDFLAQFDDDEGVPEDLLHGPPAVTPDGQRTRKFVAKKTVPSDQFEQAKHLAKDREDKTDLRSTQKFVDEPTLESEDLQEAADAARDMSGWDDDLDEDDVLDLPERYVDRVSNRSGGRPATRSEERVRPRARSRGRRSNSPLIFAGIGVVFVVFAAFAVYTSGILDGGPGTVEFDHEAAAKAEVEELLESASVDKPAAHDGTPTISPKAIIMALMEDGWRPGKRQVNDLGDVEQTSVVLNKDDMAASLTIYKTRSYNIAEELLAETRSPAEGITFGSTMVRVAPGPSRNKSGVTPVVARLYHFKTVAREAADDDKRK